MKPTFLLPTAAAILAVALFGHTTNAGETPQVIVLKLDDVVSQRSPDGLPVPPRWQRVTDFLKESDIKGSFGIIGFSLEEDNQPYFDWIKKLHKSGLIEFWNHGYRNRKATDKNGEFEGSFEEQKAALEKTQRLAKEKLGIELKTFGPHWSGTNEGTARALEGIPEIKMWFYGPTDSGKFIFPRFLTLENPTHVPDFAKFKEAYDRVGYDKECLALQGHPNSWDDERWANFVKIIDFLKSKGCVFMTPSEYMVKVSDAEPAPNASRVSGPAASEFTSTFPVNKANLVSIGRNPYFVLEPGYRLHFKAEDAILVVTVLDDTKTVDGVETRVVEEREAEGGELIEVSRNYFAIDKTTNDLYYFGEDVDIYKRGKVVGHGGAWWSGVDGAKFGMMMPGKPKVGDKFYQELAPRVAMDRCEVVAVSETVKTPAGAFKDCLRTKETSPLERGASVKVYASGVGLVRDDEFLLVKVERPAKGDEAGWTSLFNGKNLDGWVVKCLPQDNDKRGYWKVVNGTITAETPPDSKHNYIWLLTEEEYGDFELRMKVQTYASSTGNSGIQVRSRYDDEAGWLSGPQVDINPPGPWRNGFIYDETKGVQVWLWPDVGRPANAKPEHAPEGWKWFHADDKEAWNDVRVVCKGTRITTIINGVTVADYDGTGRLDDETHRAHNVGMKGHIGLQIHPGKQLLIRFKDIEVRGLE